MTNDLSTVLKGWALVLRDLCDQGATSVKVTLAGGTTVRYAPETGARLNIDGTKVRLTDLDATGMVLVDDRDIEVPSSLRSLVNAGVFELEGHGV